MLKFKHNNKGFTLVELLVVVAIIGILAVVAVPKLFNSIHKGKIAEVEADYSAIRAAVLSEYAETNKITHYGTVVSQKNIMSELEGDFDKSPIGGQYNFLPNITYIDPNGISHNYMDEYKSDIKMVTSEGIYVDEDITKFELVLHIKGYDNYKDYGYPIVPNELFKKLAKDIGYNKVFVTKDLSSNKNGLSDIFIGLIEK